MAVFAGLWDKLPHDLEIVLKTGLLELKAKNFDWRKPAEELESILQQAGPDTLLLIDELPLLIGSIVQDDPNGPRAERFLLWLKRLREQYRPRWFFAGSIGLDSVARRLKCWAPYTTCSRSNSEPSPRKRLAPT